MKVADLEDGCLVKPKGMYNLRIQPLYENAIGVEAKAGVEELKGLGYHHHATITKRPRGPVIVRSPLYGEDTDAIAIYTGSIKLKGVYFGVHKQHTFIVEGRPIIMDGYEIKGFEKIQ